MNTSKFLQIQDQIEKNEKNKRKANYMNRTGVSSLGKKVNVRPEFQRNNNFGPLFQKTSNKRSKRAKELTKSFMKLNIK